MLYVVSILQRWDQVIYKSRVFVFNSQVKAHKSSLKSCASRFSPIEYFEQQNNIYVKIQ